MGIETLIALGIGAQTAASIASVTVPLMTAMSIASAASGVIGGIQAKSAAEQQSENAMASAEMAGKETARLASEKAVEVKADTDRVRRAQKLAFLASGVDLEGSPLLMMETTRAKGAANVEEIIRSGASGYATALSEGRVKSQSLKQSGRMEFMKGLTGAGASLMRLA